MSHQAFALPLHDGSVLALGPQPLIMGILNVTPDSFSDGGQFVDLDAASAHARQMVNEGAALIDVGGESTRPGGEEVGTQDELDRVIPAIEQLVGDGMRVPVSIDTYKTVVADQAVQAGATIINDVYGLQRECEIADVAALYNVPLIAMHWDKDRDRSKDLIDEMRRYFERTIEIADKAGVQRARLILDPGFGFGKNLSDNYELLRRLDEIAALGYPLLIGTSRKSMIGKLLEVEPRDRLAGTLATTVMAYQKGGHIFRVHDVKANRQALQVATATLYGPPQMDA